MTLARRGCEAAVRRASEIRRGTFTGHANQQMSQESSDILEDTDVLVHQDVQPL